MFLEDKKSDWTLLYNSVDEMWHFYDAKRNVCICFFEPFFLLFFPLFRCVQVNFHFSLCLRSSLYLRFDYSVELLHTWHFDGHQCQLSDKKITLREGLDRWKKLISSMNVVFPLSLCPTINKEVFKANHLTADNNLLIYPKLNIFVPQNSSAKPWFSSKFLRYQSEFFSSKA